MSDRWNDYAIAQDRMAEAHESMAVEGVCPRCDEVCGRDEVDVGVGIIAGPWGCSCGWSEDPAYDVLIGGGFQPDGGYRDSRGGYWPRDNPVIKAMRGEK